MFFNQLTFYRITDTLPTPDTIASKLAEHPFAPCLGLDWFNEGFAPPQPTSSNLIHIAGDTLAICLHHEEKVLPPALITHRVNETAQHIEQTEHRKVGKRERHEIREHIIDTLLPQALAKPSQTHALLDYKNQLLLINATPKTVENLLSKLREALGGLNVKQPETQTPLAQVLTHWLQQSQATDPFTLDDNGTLKDPHGGATIKASKQDLSDSHIAGLVQNGKTATQLGLIWREQIQFTLNDNFALRRLRFLDSLVQESQQQGDDADTLFRAEQIIQAANLAQLIADLAKAAGGWKEN